MCTAEALSFRKARDLKSINNEATLKPSNTESWMLNPKPSTSNVPSPPDAPPEALQHLNPEKLNYIRNLNFLIKTISTARLRLPESEL